MALRLLLLPAAVLNMIALAAATAPLDPREMALGPARLNQHDSNHARRAVHHHRKHLSRRRIKNESRREAPAYAARQVRDSREAHRRWTRRLEDNEGELARRAAPSALPVICLGTVTAYQQCGGMGWSGDTCCISGYTCVVSDAYYSQCRPVATTTTTSATTSTSSSASPTPSGCTGAQTAYGQCGGIGYTGDTCCPSGYYCSYSNPYWSQCSPGTPLSSSSTTTSSSSSTRTTTTSTTTSPAATPTGCSGLQVGYGQCGGIGYSGPTCCTSGWTCTYSNDYYSQCLPAASSSMTPTPSSTSSSSSSSSTSKSTSTTSTTSSSTSKSTSTTSTTSSSTTTSRSTTSTTTTTSSASATPSAACSGMQTGYGQCGGIGWSGATCCPSGWTCAFSNDYYSQCLPASGSSSTTTSSTTTTTSSKTSTTTTTSSSKTSYTTTTSSSSPTPSSSTLAAALGQCGGLGFAQLACPSGYVCAIINPYYSQCLPVVPSVTYTTTIKSTSTTSSSATPSATPSQACKQGSSGSDGCTPYTVSYAGVTLPAGQTFPAGGHVNYQAIPKSQYSPGQTYTKPGAGWTPSGFSGNFDPNNNQPGGIYIGRNFFDFGAAAQAFPGGYCIIWVQVADYNQHFGEGGQAPICTP